MSDRQAADPELAAIMRAVGCHPAWAAVAVVGLLAVAVAALGVTSPLPAWVRYLPLAASLLLFGLPHGAIDHLAPARAAGRRTTPRWMVLVGVVYLLLGGGYALLWTVAPVASAVLFVALTWFHWGQGDLYALEALGADYLDGPGVRAGTLFVRGGLPMLVPLLAHPDRYRQVVDAWVSLFGRDLAFAITVDGRLGLAVAFATVTVATLLAGYRRANGRVWRRDVAETVALWLYFLVVPPLVAIGVYFCLWHSLRHLARLIGIDRDGARATFSDRGAIAALARTGREAAPLTGLSVVLLVGAGVAVGVETAPGRLAALYLVFIAVLTLPHVAVVTWMDRAERHGVKQ
ncbi:Brp/Blh family beta-carotene 15,15'-dioxygenase [Haloplanus sp.]|uniref:Brp/Blh family beta-carotene 15,15'-dioxygenase n=1 Tax=Haloplanus sp. TaxID=1961696 RepID=UPI002604DBF5|nr:Brp/Blh family beta-carotene 15,15'-dioxygenase [Haloplanus sp.]